MSVIQWRTALATFAIIAVLAGVAYGPFQILPFITDDYLQVQLSRDYGTLSGLKSLAFDALYRCRATSLVLTHWTESLFGLQPLAYNLSSLLVHMLNAGLIFALGFWKPIGWRVSAVAAAFFAIYEGHQEAVIWYAALPELLVFTFVLLSVIFWLRWLQSDSRPAGLYVASLACYVLALLSKESAVVVAGLLPLTLLVERARWRRDLWMCVPYAALAAVYAVGVFTAQGSHQHLSDGTFSIQAFWPLTIRNTLFRLFWFWGFLSLLTLLFFGIKRHLRLLAIAFGWIIIVLLPYSFLTYMPRVPSRHTYLAAAGLSLVVGVALLTLYDRAGRARRWIPVSVAAIMLAHNCGYLWTKKMSQFKERAEATESLLRFAHDRAGPIIVHCFPFPTRLAKVALEVTGTRKPEEIRIWEWAPDEPIGLDDNLFCSHPSEQPHVFLERGNSVNQD